MIIGKMNKRIVIQKLTETQDDIGNPIEDWVNFYGCFAYINGLSGKEYYAAAATQGENTVVFEIRYNLILKGMDTTRYNILFDGKTYDIKNIDNVRFHNAVLKIRAVVSNG